MSIDINAVGKFATSIANLCFANLNEKEKIRDSIIEFAAAVAIESNKDEKLKKQLVEYVKLNNNKQV